METDTTILEPEPITAVEPDEQKQARMWRGLELPRGVFERHRGSDVLWIRYGVGSGRMKLEVAGKYTPGVRTPKAVLRDCMALLERRRTEIRQGRKFPERRDKKPILFDEIAEDALRYSKKYKLPSFENDEQRMRVWEASFKGRKADEITSAEIKRVLEELEDTRELAPATVNHYKLIISMTYRVAIEAEKVTTNPALGVKLRKLNNKRERWFSVDEERRFRETLNREYPEHVCEFNVLYYSGLRLGDVYGRHGKYYQTDGLDWSNVNLELHQVTIPVDKNGEVKHVPLSPEAETALRILGERSGFQGRVMVDSQAQPIRTMGKWFWRTLRLAGIKNFRRHDLRHNLGSLLVQNGVAIQKVQMVLGHTSLKSTLRYAHFSQDDAVQAASVLGKVRPIGSETSTKTDTSNSSSS